MPDVGHRTSSATDPQPFGAFLNAVISFLLIVAAVVYFFIVMPYTKAKERFFPSEEEGTPADIALLEEIRDLLGAQRHSRPRLDADPCAAAGSRGAAVPGVASRLVAAAGPVRAGVPLVGRRLREHVAEDLGQPALALGLALSLVRGQVASRAEPVLDGGLLGVVLGRASARWTAWRASSGRRARRAGRRAARAGALSDGVGVRRAGQVLGADRVVEEPRRQRLVVDHRLPDLLGSGQPADPVGVVGGVLPRDGDELDVVEADVLELARRAWRS